MRMADQMNQEQDYEVREEPKFISFAQGDFLEGILIGVEKATAKGKPVTRYTVMRMDDSAVCFIGTRVLDRKLRLSDLAHRIEITCTGEDPAVKRGDNCMKLFNVKVWKKRVANAPLIETRDDFTPEITDADIPF